MSKEPSGLNLDMELLTKDVSVESLHGLSPVWLLPSPNIACLVNSAPITYLFNKIMLREVI